MSIQDQGKKHPSSIALLDPMRFLAAASVIAWHLSDHVPYVIPGFSSAAFAVDIFMNLSGFLMAYHYYLREDVEPWNSVRTASRFYLRRFFRIAPLYYVLLVFLFVWQYQPDWHWLVMRLTFLFGFVPDEVGRCLMPDWSIALEMQFYLLFPLLALLVRRIGFGAFFFLSSLVGALSYQLFSYYSDASPGILGTFPQPSILPLKIHVFAVGIVGAGLLMKGRRVLLSWWYIPSFVLFSATCQFNYTKLLAGMYFLAYLAFLAPRSNEYFSRVLGSANGWLEKRRWLCWPAELTYSGYLIHNIIIVIGLDWLISMTGINGSGFIEFCILLTLTLVAVTITGILLFFTIERPGIRLGKRMTRMDMSWIIDRLYRTRSG